MVVTVVQERRRARYLYIYCKRRVCALSRNFTTR